MVKVLFVCLGNICRSPMAEAVFRHLVKERGLEHVITVDSAGTGSWHVGEPPHAGTRRILSENKIDYSGIRARQVARRDLEEFDYIIAMDATNLNDLRRLAGPRSRAVIARLLDFVPERETDDVPDPYYTGNFAEVYRLIRAGCEHLLETIMRDHRLTEEH
ncbi:MULTISPECIES: low molecular weight protein-tyrosine-phosphatase [Geobacillus]|uniref:protein-tyrosine-phosphatase n=1 Tax=Geobacillus subterraneus TaxID=129338 RepID=A0A679FUB4_9BACL|nr:MULTISPECIES: low molecular weight protein-tyrosine-phosphatase [Geobacillus]NNV06709.1 low molecular weight phosphotyrosine protein phosphatase [Geobacillus sp. MMMUD3]TWG29414.1 protein-tyrosine phosphatase [Geobacillus sp. C56-T2]BBW98579.1 low molecular weight protein-tyrosine-phosphatase YfkJ [Geobacillus subterraneus]